MSTPLLKLYKGSYTSAQLLEKCTEGAIVFDKNTKRIYAGTDSSTPFMFGSNIQDAEFANSILKIWKVGDAAGSPSISLNFSDIASASSMMAVFQSLYEKIGLSGEGHDQIDYSGTNYLTSATTLIAGDKALDTAIKAVSDKVDNLDVTEYEQAAIDTTTSQTETTFKVKSIKEVDGKISAGTGTTDIKLDGSYNASTNKIATQSTVTNAVTKAANSPAQYDTTATEISSTWVSTVNSNVIAANDTFDADIDKLDKKIAGLADELIRDEQVINQTVNTLADSIGLEDDLSIDLSSNDLHIIKDDTSVKEALVDLDAAIHAIDAPVDDVQINGTSIVDGSDIANIAVDGTYDATNNKIASKSTVTNAIEALDTNEYAQAEITTTTGASTLKIKSIKEVDGKIAAGTTTPTFDVAIEGEYNASSNKIATQSTVTNAIDNLDAVADADTASGTGYATITTETPTADFKVLNSITEQDGKLTAGTAYNIKKVAATGAAEDVSYTNTNSHLSATNAQTAIDELDTRIDALEGSFDVIISTDAATTPAGVKWMDGQTEITGTLAASAITWHKIYLVPSGSGKDSYQEYITLRTGTAPSYTYSWEKLGNTSVDLLGYVKTITVNGKSYPVDTNSTNITLVDMITSITGETAISGGVSDLVAVTATTTKDTTNGTNSTILASSVKVEEVADGIVKDGTASYTDGHYVIENNKLVSAVGKSSGDTYTISANDGLTKASDVKAYVDSAITDASFRWSEWA